MTSIGMLLSILAIGVLIFIVLRPKSGGGCCGHADDRHDHAGPDQAGQPDSEPKQKPKSGCCG